MYLDKLNYFGPPLPTSIVFWVMVTLKLRQNAAFD